MKFYQLADGILVGTQVEAKKSGQDFKIVDVPTDKDGLRDYVNALKTTAGADSPADAPEPARPAVAGQCPRCAFKPDAAERWVATATADELAKWMSTAPTGKIADVMVALADRLRD